MKAETKREEMIVENHDGQEYRYYPLGEYIVASPDICGGRPTIKDHRLSARDVLGMLKRGDSRQRIARVYHIPLEAVDEVVRLAKIYDYDSSYA